MEHLLTYWAQWQAVISQMGAPGGIAAAAGVPTWIKAMAILASVGQIIALLIGGLFFILQFVAFFRDENAKCDARTYNIASTLILGTLLGGHALGGFLFTFTVIAVAVMLSAIWFFGWFLYKLWWPVLPTPGNKARWVIDALSAKRPQ